MKVKPPREAITVLLDVADMAVVWWVMKRPIQWSVKQHLENPGINCTASDTERRLAIAVGRWVALQAVK